MTEDKYLSKLLELEDSVKSKEKTKSEKEANYSSTRRWGYKSGLKEDVEKNESFYLSLCPYDIGQLGEYEKGQVLKLASDYMSKGDKGGVYSKGKSAIIGFRLYNSLGLANRISVKRRLINALQKDKNLSIKDINEAKSLLEIALSGNKSIEKKVLPAIFGAITLAGILFGANGFTGAVVGITEKSSLILGVGLFLAGILGLFVSLKNFNF
jgi:hypothetical protein